MSAKDQLALPIATNSELSIESSYGQEISRANDFHSSHESLDLYKRADCRTRWWVKFTSGTSLVVATASSICSIGAPSLVQGNLGKWIATAAAGLALVTGFAHLAVSKRSEFDESRTINGLGTVYPYSLSEFQGFHKRDSIDLNVTGAYTIDGIGSNMPGIVTLDSANNSHIAITIGDYSIGEMLQEISEVEPYLPSNETTSTNSTALAKRRNYYGVSWMSYNYEVFDYLNANRYKWDVAYHLQQFIDAINKGYEEQAYPDAEKYCVCMSHDDSSSYAGLGFQMGVWGERIDGYCKNTKCGAQHNSEHDEL